MHDDPKNRFEAETNRNVYQDTGYLMGHLKNLPSWKREELAEPTIAWDVSLSLANVMKLRCPIVIMEEATEPGAVKPMKFAWQK